MKNNKSYETAMEMCESCVHRRVCVYMEGLVDLELDSPVSMKEVECEEYLGEENTMDDEPGNKCEGCPVEPLCKKLNVECNDEGEDEVEDKPVEEKSMMKSIIEGVKLVVSKDYRVEGVMVNEASVKGLVGEMNIPEALRPVATLDSIGTPVGMVKLIVSELVDDDEFIIVSSDRYK